MSNHISLSSHKTSDGNERISLKTPYHPDLPEKAKTLGGRWNPSDHVWTFDIRDMEKVCAVVKSIYGFDPSADALPDLVTCRVRLDSFQLGSDFFFLGRQLAKRTARDSSVTLGDGVIVTAGGFSSSGGSVKNPKLSPIDGTELEVRDVPKDFANQYVHNYPNTVYILQDSSTPELPSEVDQLMARFDKLSNADQVKVLEMLKLVAKELNV